MAPKRIVIADDHKLILEGLCDIFADIEEIEVVGTALNGRELVSVIVREQPDLVMTDLNMPSGNGLEVMSVIKNRFPEIKILILSNYSASALVKKALELEVDGYMLKEHGGDEVVEAVRSILKGKTFFSEGVYQENRQDAVFQDEFLTKQLLTKREIQILQLIVQSLSNKEIGEKLFISEYTVKTHRRNLKKKINAQNTADLVKFALKLKV